VKVPFTKGKTACGPPRFRLAMTLRASGSAKPFTARRRRRSRRSSLTSNRTPWRASPSSPRSWRWPSTL